MQDTQSQSAALKGLLLDSEEGNLRLEVEDIVQEFTDRNFPLLKEKGYLGVHVEIQLIKAPEKKFSWKETHGKE